ncbi:hypothetical protein N658DRAFT_161429 [Parathielavia hyrcaniae]|uniref:Uncharacterized protein n=1 Tax=Parathielavia hyrcaniae TaxID=113614 RepID=A0AAN6Q0Q6_9PEZI|nr:hypothetical protein N658DRAFT_161429 [Parathielavia hyrcaniae]
MPKSLSPTLSLGSCQHGQQIVAAENPRTANELSGKPQHRTSLTASPKSCSLRVRKAVGSRRPMEADHPSSCLSSTFPMSSLVSFACYLP